MKISIIIPVYNTEKYINECLASILTELDPNIEVLLLDDGSTDGSYELIKLYESENIRIFHHENQGVSYTRNRGIRESKGDYLLFVDSDDILYSDWKSSILSSISNEDVIYFSSEFKTNNVEKNNILENIFSVNSKIKLGNMSSPCSKLYKREFIMTNNIFFNEKIIHGEDSLFNLQVILETNSFNYVKIPIYKYRLHVSSSTHKYNEKFFDSNIEFLNTIEKILKSYDIENNVIERYISRSVVYSSYLYLYLISTIRNKERKQYAITKLNQESIKKYLRRFFYSLDCSFLVNVVYICIKIKLYFIASLLMNIRNILKRENLKKEKWGNI